MKKKFGTPSIERKLKEILFAFSNKIHTPKSISEQIENAFEFSGIHFQFIKIVKAAGAQLDIYLYASKASLNTCSIGIMHCIRISHHINSNI